MAIHRVQEGLTGFLALDSDNFKQPVQLVLSLRNLFNHPQLLRIQNVEHVVKNRLQVTGVQAYLPQHCVLLFCGEEKGGKGTEIRDGTGETKERRRARRDSSPPRRLSPPPTLKVSKGTSGTF